MFSLPCHGDGGRLYVYCEVDFNKFLLLARTTSITGHIIVMIGRCVNKTQAYSNKPEHQRVTTLENAWSTRKANKQISMRFKMFISAFD